MKKGFTLLELAIVMVVIGLIVGGITVGREMLYQAELTNGIKKIQEIKTAVALFKEKHHFLPGDMPNATDYWTSTVNGNGDSYWNRDDDVFGTEGGWAWHQLSSAGIYGSYPAVSNINDFSLEYGTNSPEIFHATAAVGQYRDPATDVDDRYNVEFNYIQIAGYIGGATVDRTKAHCKGLSPNDAFLVDEKIDNGDATSGKFLAYSLSDPSNGDFCDISRGTCTTGGGTSDWQADPGDVDYDLSQTNGACRLAFSVE